MVIIKGLLSSVQRSVLLTTNVMDYGEVYSTLCDKVCPRQVCGLLHVL